MKAPIYTTMFTTCDPGTAGAFPVRGESPDGSYTIHLRKINSLNELADDMSIYVQVDHQTKYPYAKIDFAEPTPSEEEMAQKPRRIREDWKPRQFAAAAVVATPKLALI